MDIKKARINTLSMVQDLLPSRVKVLANNLRIAPSYFSWFSNSSWRKHTAEDVQPFFNKFIGCRCIIIGNGPSLREMDLQKLQDEFTFGLNRFYLMFRKLNFETTFFVAINRLVIEQFGKEISVIKGPKFINWAYRKHVPITSKTIYLPAKPTFRMSGNINKGYYGMAGTVTNVALEIAFYMGFSEVILIGVDHSFGESGRASLAVVSGGEDKNHFDPSYFGKGVVWQLPDYLAMERGYKQAKELFGRAGRIIVDATKQGKLNVFPKVHFDNYLDQSSFLNRRSFLLAEGGKKAYGFEKILEIV